MDGLNIYPIMHPAAALHRQELRKIIEEDFKAIPELLMRADRTESRAPETKTPETKTPETAQPHQLTMF